MKILYVAHERGAVVLAAPALRAAAPAAALTWSNSFESAIHWLQANTDTAAVVVDADVQGPHCDAFVEQVRALGVATALVPVSSASRLASALAPLTAGGEQADTERQRAERRDAPELAAAAARLADLQVRHSASLAREARVCTALQERLFELEGELRHLEDQRAKESATLAEQLAKRHEEYCSSLTLTARSRDDLAARVSEMEAALDEARQARRTEAAAAAEELRRREADFAVALAEAVAARATLENALADAEATHRDARQRAEADLAAANERQAALEDLLAQEADRRALLDGKLAAGHAAQQEADDRHTAEQTMAAVRLAEAQAQLDAAEAAHAAALRASEDERQQIQQERDELRQRFEQSQVQLDRLQATVEGERQAYEHARSASDSAWQRLSAEHGQQREAFDQLQTAFQTLEQVASALSAERARLEGAVGERDSQLSAQAERHRVAEQAAHETIAQLEEQRREALDSSRSETARLQETIGALTRELDGLRTRAEALRGDAGRVPDLQAQLDASRREARRLFERARYGVCHCTAAGVITDANHTFVTLLGRRRVEELRNTDFAAAVVDCAGDLGWVLERARTVRKTETVETNWMTRDGRPLVVRLQALSTAAGSLEIVVEDITEARALEARLRQAQRMEAVGRLASEVAVTCDGLLRDVTGSAHEWLAAIARDDPRRRQVEWLLTDVQRAASFLQHLGVYSASQARALEPVSVQRVLQDLAPVLKQVVGERIDVVTPKASSNPFDVEVDAERVERILVTVAAYARARIADGGQMKIDLATTTVGRRLIARFPSVRPGPHVLVTVTELPGARASRHEEAPAASGDKPGVDLGGLMDLVSNCGGHLWVDAQPAGNLVVKIHLPRAAAGATSATRRSDVHSERGGRLARWLRLGSNGVRA